MNSRFLSVAVSAVLVTAAAPTFAASILIDDFDVYQRVVDEPLADPSNSQVEEGIGGNRDLFVETNDGDLNGSELVARDSLLEFNNVSGNTGRGWVTYDGANVVGADPTTVDTKGLNVDLLRGGDLNLTGFFFDIVEVDADLFIEIRVWDRAEGYSFFNETLVEGGGNPFVPFAAFTGDVDWSSVGALQFFAESGPCNDDTPLRLCVGDRVASLDGAIDSIRVDVIPLPAPALLLLGGLGGLGALRLRKRKA